MKMPIAIFAVCACTFAWSNPALARTYPCTDVKGVGCVCTPDVFVDGSYTTCTDGKGVVKIQSKGVGGKLKAGVGDNTTAGSSPATESGKKN